MGDLGQCERRLESLLQHQAAEQAGWYVGYDTFPGELHGNIRRYRQYVADLREKLGLPPYEEPKYHKPALP